MSQILDVALLTGWTRAATSALERHCAEIDRINVFPVPDGDTGTNLLLTMRSAAEAVRRAVAENGRGAAAVAGALARGALVGARGNSGMILSQVLRGLAEAIAPAVGTASGGAVLGDALRRAHRLATAAVSRPREGTVLSVLAAAAGAAAGSGSDRLDDVAVAAADAAGTALRATTGQLPELSRAGVVDAGGLGLYLVLDALAGLVSGRQGAAELPKVGRRPAVPVACSRETIVAERDGGSSVEHDYEVMYLLDGTDPERIVALRSRLAALGDCVAVAGDADGLWSIHVHCTDVGAAVEAGIEAGRPHRVTVSRFADAAPTVAPLVRNGRFTRERAVLMVAMGGAVADLARSAGAAVLEREPGAAVADAEVVAALAGTRARHVVLLPDDPELTAAAERVAPTARRDGQEVLVVPTVSVLQGLSALAVHDPARRPDEDVVAMAEAAAGTRTGGLTVAESEALTWVGRCEPGEVLGIVDGEVVLIAPDLAVGGLWLGHRMLTAGGEIVTILLGEGVPGSLGEGLAADLRCTHPEVDVVVHRGGQTDRALVMGVE